MSTKITRKKWGTNKGKKLYLFTFKNKNGAYAEITNYGASIVSIVVPDKDGKPGNVVLGFLTAEGYLNDKCCIGSTIGRYANRISGAKFMLDGNTYHLEANDGVNSIHGGSGRFNCKVFDFEIVSDHLLMKLHSKDGDGGFPGNLDLRIAYKWSDENELLIHYWAVSDKNTIASFTNHAYFNLSNDDPDILNHRLTISADNIVDANDAYIPTGKLKPAAENAFHNNKIREKTGKNNRNIPGINSYYILDHNLLTANTHAAKLICEASGRTLEVFTSYPGIFLYTGDFLTSKHLNHKNRYCQPFEGLCLECQHYPDSINRPEFPSAVLPKEKFYDEYIIFKFGLL